MLLARRAYRRRFPRLREPWLDGELVWRGADRGFEAAYLREVGAAGGGPGEAAFLAARYREGMRWRGVLRPGGPILLTTPPRLRYALRRDPHFGLRGLALLPAGWQRSRAARHGFVGPHHYVHRLYGTAAQVARLFPGCRLGRVLSRSRAPGRWFWDALVLTKVE